VGARDAAGGGRVATLGMLVRDRRQAAGQTQRQLAEAAGVSVGAIRDLEQGISGRPRRATMQSLATALRVSVGEFLAWSAPGGDATCDGTAGPVTRFQVFGRLKAWRDDVEVPLPGARRRAVLGLLLLRSGKVLSRDAIADALWEGWPPATAASVIQSHISRLRAVLDPEPSPAWRLIQTAGDGYRLARDGIAIDLLQAQGLLARARAALRAGDLAGSCGLYDQALTLGQGQPLADVPLLRGNPTMVALENELGHLVVEYAEAASALGWHDRVLPHLYALAERDPLNERAHACLMIALAGSGQQAAALAVFEQLWRRLDDQLGVRPGAILADAHTRVLRSDVSVMAPAALTVGAGPGIGSPTGGAETWPFQLPSALADFTGRAAELSELVEWLRPGGPGPAVPVVVICGSPGAGKSALMLQAGHVLRESFPDGQLWADLNGSSDRPQDPGDVLGEWLRALGVHGSAIPDAMDRRAALYRSRLADRRVLIVADDAGSAAQVVPLLPGTAGCAVMVTSRRRLAELAGARLLSLGPLSVADATNLLGQVAGPERVAAEPQAAADLVTTCGLLPLAVRIAGSKLAARPAAPIAAMGGTLATERRRLDVLQVGDISVRASIASGYGALSEPARRAFRLLGLLGACDLAEWTVAALLGEIDAGRLVDELADRSMLALVGTDATGVARFRLHDLLRDYAVEVLSREPGDERTAALQRVHNGWLQLACLASDRLPPEPFFPRDREAATPTVVPDNVAHETTSDPIGWFHAERLNILAVTRQACQLGRYEYATRLALRLAEFQHLQSRYLDAVQMWRSIADAARAANDIQATARSLLRLASATVECGYSADAMGLLDECVAMLKRCGATGQLAYALYWRSAAAWDQCHFEAAQGHAERGVRLAQRGGDRHAEYMNLRGLGQSLNKLGDYARGSAACQKAVSIAVELGEDSFRQYALHDLAHICIKAGRYHEAIDLSLRRFELCRQVGDLRGEALSMCVLGDAYHGLGRFEDAVAAFEQALPVFRDHFIRRFHAVCLFKLGCAHAAMGNPMQANRSLRESLPIFRELRLPAYEESVREALRALRPTLTG
jgi:DNA-binding SARP family transcriptional activator/DNA-binding XRE family transcriptional regulator